MTQAQARLTAAALLRVSRRSSPSAPLVAVGEARCTVPPAEATPPAMAPLLAPDRSQPCSQRALVRAQAAAERERGIFGLSSGGAAARPTFGVPAPPAFAFEQRTARAGP